MPRPPRERSTAEGTGTSWWTNVGRIYLDNSVFEHHDAVACLLKQVVPELQMIHRNDVRVRVVLDNSARATAERHLSAADGGAALWDELFGALEALPNLEWIAAPGGTPGLVEQTILSETVRHCPRFRQVVFTQNRAFADKVRAGTDGDGSNPNSKTVSARCVLAHASEDWNDYDYRSRQVIGPAGLKRFRYCVIDTSSLKFTGLRPGGEENNPDPPTPGLRWLSRAVTTMSRTDTRLIVVDRVFRELAGLSRNPAVGTQLAAKRALDWLNANADLGVIDRIPGLREKSIADHEIKLWFHQNAHIGDICVVTQDKTLSRELLAQLPGPPRRSCVCAFRRDEMLQVRTLTDLQQSHEANNGEASSKQRRTLPQGGADRSFGSASSSGESAQSAARTGPKATASAARHTVLPPPPGTSPTQAAGEIQSQTYPHRRWVSLAAAGLLIAAMVIWLWPTSDPELQVLVNDKPVPVNGETVMLSSGTLFTVTVRPSAAGNVELHAYNASRSQSPTVLLRTRAGRGQRVSSPVLRVERSEGVDRLELRLVPDEGPPSTQTIFVRQN